MNASWTMPLYALSTYGSTAKTNEISYLHGYLVSALMLQYTPPPFTG